MVVLLFFFGVAHSGLTKEQNAILQNKQRVESVFSAARLPAKFHQDLLHSFSAAAVIDLTPGQGHMLEACLDSRTPVLGFGLTETHCTMLEERLTRYVLALEKFKENGHTMYREDAAKALGANASSGTDPNATDAEPKPKAKPKPGPERKKNKDGSDAEEEEEVSEESQPKPPKKKKNKKPQKKKKNLLRTGLGEF